MKKILSFLLAISLMLGLCIPAYAASVTPSVDKTQVQAGEEITVTLTLDAAIENVGGIQYRVYYDTDKFEYISGTAGSCVEDLVISEVLMSDAAGTYRAVTWLDTTSTGKTVNAGVLATFTFKAKYATTTDTAAFQVTSMVLDALANDINDGTVANSNISVSITPAPAVEGYAVSLSADKTIVCGEQAQVSIDVENSAETTYNAYHYVLTYDTTKLSYVSATGATDVSDSNGTITIIGYGADKACGTDAVTLTFTGKATGETKVTLTSAKVDKAANANAQNAPAATITDDETVITVGNYTVILPSEFTGEETAAPGSNYTFTATDKNYTYTVTATMGGEEATVKDNSDGTFTIENVSGNIVVTLVGKTPKSYNVTVNGTASSDVTAEKTAAYGTNFTFTVTKDDAYTYDVSATVNGVAYTPAQGENGTYTITGSAIVGDIVITANKTLKPPTTTTITFTGEGSTDVANGTEQTATNGQPFTFSINKVAGYAYVVKLDGEALTANEDGTYTIPGDKINGTAISVTVEKTVDVTWTVNVTEYVNLGDSETSGDAQTMYLVYTTGTVADGKVLTYSGEKMFWSEKYGGYAYLVISGENLETVKTNAVAAITIADGTNEGDQISYGGDINGTGVVDVNDAQLVYDMYNAKYQSFESVTMERFLRADMNGSKSLSVEDAAAIVSIIKTN